MNKNLTIRNSITQFLIYKSDNQDIKVDALLEILIMRKIKLKEISP